MSYSRWDKSYFYTYWDVSSPEYEDIEDISLKINKIKEQVFKICMVCDFTYNALTGDIEACLNVVRYLEPQATLEDLAELKSCMKKFIEDMDEEIEKAKNNF